MSKSKISPKFNTIKRVNSKELVIYPPTWDGICGAWVTTQEYEDYNKRFDYLEWPNDNKIPDVKDYKSIICIGLSFPRKILDRWVSEGRQLSIYEYRKSRQDALQGVKGVVLDERYSPCVSMWKNRILDREVPILFHYVEAMTLHNYDIKYIFDVINGLSCYNKTIDTVDELVNDHVKVITDGQGVKRYKELEIRKLLKEMRLVKILGYQVPCLNTQLMFTDVLEALYNEYPCYPFVAIYYDTIDNYRQYYIASNPDNDFDVSVIAAQLNGDGSKFAARFKIKNSDSRDYHEWYTQMTKFHSEDYIKAVMQGMKIYD